VPFAYGAACMATVSRSFNRIFSADTAGTDVLRLVVSAILFTHGSYRLLHGEAPVLGDILKDEGVPAGVILAYLICLAETAGTVLLASRLMVWPVTIILCLIYFTGIMMFHRHNGFFVVGPGSGGWEYSAVLITCLVVTAWENRNNKLF
jgi:putative oxidoreductase